MSELPRYELLAPYFAQDHSLYDEGSVLTYDGIPNEMMRPLNEPAKVAYTNYMRSIPDGKTPPLEEIVYKAMLGRPKDGQEIAVAQIIEALKAMLQPAEEARKAQAVPMPVAEREKPLLGNDPRAVAAQARKHPHTFQAEELLIEPRVKGKRAPVMGTIRANEQTA